MATTGATIATLSFDLIVLGSGSFNFFKSVFLLFKISLATGLMLNALSSLSQLNNLSSSIKSTAKVV